VELLLGQVLEPASTDPDRPVDRRVSSSASFGRTAGRPRPRAPFAAAPVEAAAAGDLESLQQSRNAALPIGTWRSADVDVAARLRAQGFSRHTFLCGQSGSGKTYAWGSSSSSSCWAPTCAWWCSTPTPTS
jgi:hypothetical protein